MTSLRDTLVPHMQHYTFWLPDQPYTMWFQEPDETTEVYSTDRWGFRHTVAGGERFSPGTWNRDEPVRLFAGSSSAFGVGASGDPATVASRLSTLYAPETPWFTFAGQAFNSTQELLLYTLFHERLPEITEIVLMSGVNDLVLARMPAASHGLHGAYFECEPPTGDDVPDVTERVATAAARTLSHLATWRTLARSTGTRLVFALQPLAPWVRERPSRQEERLFDDLDRISNFTSLHYDIADPAVGRRYAELLGKGCAELGVEFCDLNPLLGARAGRRDWLFVDRVHLLDDGYELVARTLAEEVGLS